jgi:general secretion pathway protein B
MPAAFRSQLPSLTIGGGMYADQPEQRLVIVNGQVLREGESASPGLVLEAVRPRSVVFSWQQQRFALPM